MNPTSTGPGQSTDQLDRDRTPASCLRPQANRAPAGRSRWLVPRARARAELDHDSPSARKANTAACSSSMGHVSTNSVAASRRSVSANPRFVALTSASVRSILRSRPASTRSPARCDSSASVEPKARAISTSLATSPGHAAQAFGQSANSTGRVARETALLLWRTPGALTAGVHHEGVRRQQRFDLFEQEQSLLTAAPSGAQRAWCGGMRFRGLRRRAGMRQRARVRPWTTAAAPATALRWPSTAAVTDPQRRGAGRLASVENGYSSTREAGRPAGSSSPEPTLARLVGAPGIGRVHARTARICLPPWRARCHTRSTTRAQSSRIAYATTDSAHTSGQGQARPRVGSVRSRTWPDVSHAYDHDDGGLRHRATACFRTEARPHVAGAPSLNEVAQSAPSQCLETQAQARQRAGDSLQCAGVIRPPRGHAPPGR